MQRTRIFNLLFVAILLISGCSKDDEAKNVEGYKPLYISKNAAYSITASPAYATITNPGKIYIKDSLIYIIEKGLGIHIINNTNNLSPKIIAFINIPGISDVAIKGNVLYADNFNDLIAVDISAVENPIVAKRLKDIYPTRFMMYPPYDCWFECVDTSKGYVYTWVKTTLKDPKCYKGINNNNQILEEE